MNTPIKHCEISVATFVPQGAAGVTHADHLALDRVANEIFGQLCAFNLDVSSELFLGHTGNGTCHAGARQDGLLHFTVSDRTHGLQVIRDGLATGGIATDHYEIAVMEGAEDNYQSVWLPSGRVSSLARWSQKALLEEMRPRLNQRDALMEKEFGGAAWMKQIEALRALQAKHAECAAQVRQILVDFEAPLAVLLRDWPVNPPATLVQKSIAWPLQRVRGRALKSCRMSARKLVDIPAATDDATLLSFQGALRSFLAAPWDSYTAQRRATEDLQAALSALIRTLAKPIIE